MIRMDGFFVVVFFKEELTKTEQLFLDEKDCLKKYMEHINHGQHQLLVQDSATKIKRQHIDMTKIIEEQCGHQKS